MFLKRALYSSKRALFPIKRAQYFIQCYVQQRKCVSKVMIIVAECVDQRWCYSKEPYIHPKEPYTLSKEANVSSKVIRNHAKVCQRYWLLYLNVWFRNPFLLYLNKVDVTQKSPIFHQKSPILYHDQILVSESIFGIHLRWLDIGVGIHFFFYSGGTREDF